MALSTTTILARLMPFGAPSIPSAKGRFVPFLAPCGNAVRCVFGRRAGSSLRSGASLHLHVLIASHVLPPRLRSNRSESLDQAALRDLTSSVPAWGSSFRTGHMEMVTARSIAPRGATPVNASIRPLRGMAAPFRIISRSFRRQFDPPSQQIQSQDRGRVTERRIWPHVSRSWQLQRVHSLAFKDDRQQKASS
jgi:hypothetical protein